jgi:CBS domain-containing membrane protein
MGPFHRPSRGPRIADVMHHDVPCVLADASLETIAAAIDKGYPCVPVVDGDSRLIGMVSSSDLTGRTGVARDVMEPTVHALDAGASVGVAVRLMSSAGLLELPVVDGEGRVVGMVTILDAILWLARRLDTANANVAVARPSEWS